MKGILLAGGRNTRLYPATQAISKQLLPVYDKPMVYYPLSVLMLAGIREIALISSPEALPLYQDLLSDGSQWGINITYLTQKEPKGIAEAFIIAEKFIDNSPTCLILGDNVFYADQMPSILKKAAEIKNGALIFAYRVNDPERFGVVEFDEKWCVKSLEEKPTNPKSDYAATGLYFYDNKVCDYAKQIKPSIRGELEITDLNHMYMKSNQLFAYLLGRGTAWLDTGTPESLIEASQFMHIIEKRQGTKIACLEEIAFTQSFITQAQLQMQLSTMPKSSYREYIEKFSRDKLTPIQQKFA